MINKIFLDTNILIYFTHEKSEFYEKVNIKLKKLLKENQLFISNQIVLEYISAITNEKKFKQDSLTIKDALNNIDLFLNFIKLTEKNPEYKDIKGNLLKYNLTGTKIFDLNIYLTMQSNKIDSILTVNKKDFDLFKDIQVMDIE